MRKSVERKRQDTPDTHRLTHRRLRRALLWIIIPIVSLSCALLIATSEQRRQQADATYQKQANDDAKALKKLIVEVAERKVEKARAAEAAAKKKAEEDAAAQKAAANTNPVGTTASVVCDVTNPTTITVILNKKHCFKPIDWAPSDLASVNGYLMRTEAATHMQQLMADAAAAGVGFELSSAYRSYYDQQVTYNNWVRVNGSQAAADTVSARPGYSEHQTGLAADLKVGSCALECFAGTAQYTWLTQNAANYGFIQRYPTGLTSITGYSPEAWHWRYVGIATATDMKSKGIQTLEQYFGVSGGDY